MTRRLTMTIGGESLDTAASLSVVNPATGVAFAEVPNAGAAELDLAVEAATAAFPAWRDTAWAERQVVVNAVGATIQAHAAELAAIIVAEQGKPRALADFEVEAAAGWCFGTALLELPERVIEDTDERFRVTRYEPIGVVCGISPWNYPLVLSIFKIAPALLAGNCMVLKPSPFTPMTVLRLGELLRDVVPAGVLNVVTGGDDLGPMMTAHPGFRKISFTGSSATGRKVMESASHDLKRLTLELGGNDAAIVFADVDVRETAEKLFWSAFTNSGQVCIATKRAYIHEDIYDDMRDALAALARSVAMGDGSNPDVALGPIQNFQQASLVRDLIAASEAAGDTLIRAERSAGMGYFEPVTLVDRPADDSPIVTNEQFGPVLPLLSFSTEDEVVARSNASDMGLAATIWTKDLERGMRVASRLETGNAWINESLALTPMAAFAGRKQSGFGVENGVEGLMAYTEPKTISVFKGCKDRSAADG